MLQTSGSFTAIFTLNLQYFSWGCSGSLSISKQKQAKFSSRNRGLDEMRGGQALLSIAARTSWPSHPAAREGSGFTGHWWDWTCRTHPASSTHAVFTPATLCLFPPALRLARGSVRISYFLAERCLRCSSVAQGLPKVSGRGTRAPAFPAKPGSKLRGEAGRRWLCRAGDGFAEPPLLPRFLGLRVSPGDKQPPSSRR